MQIENTLAKSTVAWIFEIVFQGELQGLRGEGRAVEDC
jgi:hypothetical protein